MSDLRSTNAKPAHVPNRTLLRKQLTALAAVVSILGIGACFVPIEHSVPRPLPPELTGTRTLGIQVEDRSSESPLDSASLSALTASRFNNLWSEFPIHAESSAGTAETTLKIQLTAKSIDAGGLTQDRQKRVFFYGVSSTATLLAANGRILKQQPLRPMVFSFWFAANATPLPWTARSVRSALAYNLAMAAGDAILHSNSRPSVQDQK